MHIVKLLHCATLVCSSLLLALALAGAEPAVNLLQNAGFQPEATGRITGWLSHDAQALASQVTLGVEDVEGARCLAITTHQPLQTNLWWEQKLSCEGGNTYAISVKVKAKLQAGSKYGGPSAGVAFEDANGKWLGFQAVPTAVSSGAWTEIKGRITVPEDAVKLTLRLGVILDGGIKAWFKEPAVSEISG